MMFSALRKLKRVLLGKDFYFKPTIQIHSIKIGNKSEGWWIADEKLQQGENVVFSFGLGEDISFDLGMIKKFNSRVYGFDPTPKSLKFIKNLELPDTFILNEYAIAEKNGNLTFNLPFNEEHVSGSFMDIESNNTITVEAKTFKTILDELDINLESIDIVKMDIEGAEYNVIENMIADNLMPKQLLIEYHHFFDSIDNQTTKKNINLLLQYYELFYVEDYNYSFIRKDVL